ncbi:MAG: hypothetical protein WCX23_00515 [Candidatus Paceibacterota bacterium]|jgi:hypothetical protein|nr:hypothetical protein [Candidatus Paceibacterota bacterium]
MDWESKAIIVFLIIAIFLLSAAVVGFFYSDQLSSISQNNPKDNVIAEKSLEEEKSEERQEENISGQTGNMEIGQGQTKEDVLAEVNPSALNNPVIPSEVSLPAIIFNTQGTIVSLEEDGITINGSGSNFEDQISRRIKVKFDEQTVVSEIGGVKKYAGFAGLEYLAAGDQVFLSSNQNIRGKTEFIAKYVNKQ